MQSHVGLFETYRYKRTGQFFIWNYIGNRYVFSKYLDNYCRYQYCANDTLFQNISSILWSIFQDILPKEDVAFCETTDTAHFYIKQIVNFSEINLSYDVAVIQWITSCHKNRMTTRYIALGYWRAQRHDAVRDNVMFSFEIISSFKAIKPHLKQSYDKQNLTLVVISYEIYETRRRLVS